MNGGLEGIVVYRMRRTGIRALLTEHSGLVAEGIVVGVQLGTVRCDARLKRGERFI